MSNRSHSTRTVVLSFALGFSILIVSGVLSHRSAVKVLQSTQQRANARQNILSVEQLLSTLKDAETGQRGFLITGKEPFLDPYHSGLRELEPRLRQLHDDLSHREGQPANLNDLEKLVAQKREIMSRIVALKRAGKLTHAKAIELLSEGKRLMDDIRAQGKEIIDVESEELNLRARAAERIVAENFWTLAIGNVFGAAVLLITALLYFRNLRERRRAEDELRVLADELEARVRERTLQVESERSRMETILHQLPAAVILAEAPSGRIVFANNKIEEVWRHPCRDSASVDDYMQWAAFHPDGRPYEPMDWPLARSLKLGVKIVGELTNILRGDGTRGFVRLSSAPVQNAQGETTGAVVVCLDVTEQLESEAEKDRLRTSEKDAQESARLKSEFLANMSHEIRTPLNGIIGMTDLLLDTPLTDVQKKYARVAQDSGAALLTIINDILDFSKIEAGKMELEMIDFELSQLVEGQMELLKPRAADKELSLMSFISPDLPAFAKSDPGRIGQVLLNLLGNAVKFTAKGSIVVRAASYGEFTGEGGCIKFSIEDTGIGLSEEARVRLFQPFTQADGSTARKYGGTGLGLSISKQLVQLLGGEIGVTSEPGKGSTFWFTIRVGRASAETVRAAQPLPTFARAPRVLVVDDDPPAGEIIEAYLRGIPSTTLFANHGEQALKILRHQLAIGQPVDLVLTDKRMPDIDGFALSRKIFADPQLAETPMVLMSAFDRLRSIDDAKAAGFRAYLTKPIKRTELIQTVAEVLRDVGTGVVTSTVCPYSPIEKPAAPSGKRILVAEDNSVNQLLVLTQLKKLGYVAQAVANGREALETLKHTPFDLVLMDCQMPEMDGFTATRMIRKLEAETGSHLPIVALTANAMKEDETRCLESGMDDYVTKPLKIEVLQKVLEKWLNSSRDRVA